MEDLPAGSALVSATIASLALGRPQAEQTLAAGRQVEIGKNVTENEAGDRSGRYPDWRRRKSAQII
jgi:hypothetical protein